MGKPIYTENSFDQMKQYRDYINTHIKNVRIAYSEYKGVFMKIFPKVYSHSMLYSQLDSNISHHDKSKLDYNEFSPYSKKFYPIKGTNPESKEVNKEFDVAWLHHIHNNPHHPNHWVLIDDGTYTILDMPDIYIIEMICDWISMSMYYKNSVIDYWNSDSAKKLPMSEYTKSKVQEFMDYIKLGH